MGIFQIINGNFHSFAFVFINAIMQAFRGTSVEQDGRWGKMDQKMLNELAKDGKFSPILDTKVNMKKINVDVFSKWITQKIIQEIGFEDDILINTVINMLQGENLDPKKMIVSLVAFLDKKAPAFVEELWTLLVDAQSQPNGIPMLMIQKKKEELLRTSVQQPAIPMKENANSTATTRKPFEASSSSTHDEREKQDRPVERRRPESPTFSRRRSDEDDKDRKSSPQRRERDNTPKRRTRDKREDSPSENNRRRARDDTPMKTRRASTPKRTRGDSPSARRNREDSSKPKEINEDSPRRKRERNRSRSPERSAVKREGSPVMLSSEHTSSRRGASPPARKSNREQTPSKRRPRRDSPSPDRHSHHRSRDEADRRRRDRSDSRDRRSHKRDHSEERDRKGDRRRSRSPDKRRKDSRNGDDNGDTKRNEKDSSKHPEEVK
jgi:serine/arginine repetitive matrix protein 1